MPTALITGIAGFTGRYLSTALQQQGYKVVGLTQGRHDPDKDLFSCDLLDRCGLADVVAQVQPYVVTHLAAISFVEHGDAEDIYRTNVVGTRNLLEALAACGKIPRVVLLASSANIYGNTTDNPIIESTLPSPANDYAVSKLAMEYMAKLWMDKLPLIIVRPFNYTGRQQAPNFLIPKIVDHYRRGDMEIELGNLDVARDFSDVRTVVSAYKKLIELAPAGETFNVCSGEAVSLEGVLEMMATIAGYAIKVRVNPAFVRESEVKCLRGSNAKLINFIGDSASIPLGETLRWMFEVGVA